MNVTSIGQLKRCYLFQYQDSFAYSTEFDEALNLAKQAGQIIKQAFHQEKEITFKGDVDLVTATDKKVEELIFSSIRKVGKKVLTDSFQTFDYQKINNVVVPNSSNSWRRKFSRRKI